MRAVPASHSLFTAREMGVISTPRARHDASARNLDQEEGLHSEREFSALRAEYGTSGGIVKGDDLARLFADRRVGDYVSLARHVGKGEVFGFEWQHALWIPMFQFDLDDLSVREQPRQVRVELEGHFAGWDVADWFVQRNVWLGRRRPVDLLSSDLPAVLQAARADRFIAAG